MKNIFITVCLLMSISFCCISQQKKHSNNSNATLIDTNAVTIRHYTD
jgi:hypothetical protein